MFGRIPFVRYVLFLLAGIFSNRFFPVEESSFTWGILAFFLGITCAYTYFGDSRKLFAKAATLLSIAVLGWGTANLQAICFQESVKAIESKDYLAYQVEITSLPEKREKNVRYLANVEKLFYKDGSERVSADVLMYFKPDLAALPATGDRMIVYGKLRRPSSASSPIGFDYREFLQRKGIAWIGSVRDPAKIAIPPERSENTGIAGWPVWLSERADLLFRTYIHNDDAYGLVKAMVLGRRDDISQELNNAFIHSGTVHILSVSGLHIAIFFTVLHLAFGFLRKVRGGKYLYLILMTGILVGYAIVTGLPASVQRATLMCIIWMLAATFSRRNEPINTLAIAAFFILLADPNAIFDVGFQLSFLAMLGIFLWSAPVSRLYRPANRVTRHFWNLSVMSIVAQMMTFPVVTYYFNQFPTYFLFANLLAVDIAGLLIPASFVLLLLGMTGIVSLTGLAGTLVNYLAVLTNYIVELPQKLPYHLVEHLYLDSWQSILLLLLIMLVHVAYTNRNARSVRYIFLTACCFSFYSSLIVIGDFRTSFADTPGNGSVIVYKSPGKLYIAENSPERPSFDFEIRKYMARYGRDTLMIKID